MQSCIHAKLYAFCAIMQNFVCSCKSCFMLQGNLSDWLKYISEVNLVVELPFAQSRAEVLDSMQNFVQSCICTCGLRCQL